MKIPALIAFSTDVGKKGSEESKVFKIVCLAGFLYFSVLGLLNLSLSGNQISSVVFLLISIGYGVSALFYPSERYQIFNKPSFFYALSFIGFNTGYIFNGGILNPSVYLLFPFLLVIIYLTDKKTTSLLITLILANYLFLFLFNFLFPQISNNSDGLLNTLEKISSHILALVFSMLVINKIFSKYKEDKEKAKKSEITKEAFLANMSHLIRTPLNGINGFADLLLDEDIPDFEKQYFKKKILTNAKELHHMIFNLIDLSIIQEKTLQLRPENFSMNEFLNSLQIKTDDEILHAEKNIEFLIDFDKPSEINDISLYLDGDRLFQLVWNFIENSISFTSDGAIRLKASIQSDIGVLTIVVEDNGSGISKNLLENIKHHNILDRNQSTVTNPTPGMGILISKGILEYLGGHIDISSEENKGTFVHIEIPIENKYEVVH